MNLNVNGYKTYIVGVGWIAWALGGFAAGKFDVNTAVQGVLMGLGLMGMRHSIFKAAQ